MANASPFKRFHDLRRSAAFFPCGANMVADLNRFQARFKVAQRFRSLSIVPCSQAVRRGYSEGVRLMLTYSAAELFGETIRPRMRMKSWKIVDESLSSRLGPIAKKLPTVDLSLDEEIKQALLRIARKDSADVMPVAKALRHMFAHGIFTPGGTGALTSRDSLAVRDLSILVQEETIRRFSQWLDHLAHQISTAES